MKRFRITARCEDYTSKSEIVLAKDKDEALEIAWELFPECDSVYVTEIE